MKHNIRTFVGTLLTLAIMMTYFMPIANASSTAQDLGPLDISNIDTTLQSDPPLDISNISHKATPLGILNISNVLQSPAPSDIANVRQYWEAFYPGIQLFDMNKLFITERHCSLALSFADTFVSSRVPDNFYQLDMLSRYAIVLAFCGDSSTAITQNFFLSGDVDRYSKSLTMSYTDRELGLIEVTIDNGYVIVNGIVLSDCFAYDLQTLIFQDGTVCVSFMNTLGNLEMNLLRPASFFSQPDCSNK